ncbi:tail fiber assembly protein [Vibrio cyclitrophicus]|uniref:tail fiber assembly protein n=1 Tax=Vibrio cyclitrophicus TaxID=47951 RepID=UPI001F533326|nr:tail fiber assembly protein [Vibrio cyclitrophicus]
MNFKKEIYQGVEYHFSSEFNDVEEYLQSSPVPDVDSNALTEIGWDEIRLKRVRLIAATDWTQTSDTPLSHDKKEEFVNYRKLLRDIPQNFNDPTMVEWPEKPTL